MAQKMVSADNPLVWHGNLKSGTAPVTGVTFYGGRIHLRLSGGGCVTAGVEPPEILSELKEACAAERLRGSTLSHVRALLELVAGDARRRKDSMATGGGKADGLARYELRAMDDRLKSLAVSIEGGDTDRAKITCADGNSVFVHQKSKRVLGKLVAFVKGVLVQGPLQVDRLRDLIEEWDRADRMGRLTKWEFSKGPTR